MRVLIDTHALLWFLNNSPRLSRRARSLIIEPRNEVLVSVGSLWKVVIKASLGRLELEEPFEELIPAQLDAERIEVLPIELRHLAALGGLPFHHRDPFDRLIIAQAVAEGIPVVSRDREFDPYPVEVLWGEPEAGG